MGETLAVYVDGFNLYHGLHDKRGHSLLWLDLVKLARNLRPESDLVKVKYFTSIVLDDPDAQARQDHYLQALQACYPNRVQVILGQYKRKPKLCRACGATWVTYEEKQTDVNMAVHVVADAAAGLTDSQMLITGDTDLIPAINMARNANPHLNIFAMFPPGRDTNALKRLMPSSRSITIAKLEQSLLPTGIERDGQSFSCPEKWRPRLPQPSETGPSAKQPAHTCGIPTPAEAFGRGIPRETPEAPPHPPAQG